MAKQEVDGGRREAIVSVLPIPLQPNKGGVGIGMTAKKKSEGRREGKENKAKGNITYTVLAFENALTRFDRFATHHATHH